MTIILFKEVNQVFIYIFTQVDFQGTLGKVSSSSVQHPRQMVDLMNIAKGQEQVFLPLLSLKVTLHVNLFKDINILMTIDFISTIMY